MNETRYLLVHDDNYYKATNRDGSIMTTTDPQDAEYIDSYSRAAMLRNYIKDKTGTYYFVIKTQWHRVC